MKSLVVAIYVQGRTGSGKGSVTYIEPNELGEIVCVDLLEIHEGFTIAVVISYFSRHAFAQIIRGKNIDDGLKVFEKASQLLRIQRVITDNGGEFMSRKFCKRLERAGIIHVKSIPYHHNSNGRVERLNRTLRTAIQKLKVEEY